MSNIDQDFVEYVVKAIVSNPDDVSIERTIDEKGVLLTLTVNPEDLGRVIGKRGVTAQSIRTLLRALGTKNEARYNLKIADNDRDNSARSQPSSSSSSTDEDQVVSDDDSSASSNSSDAWSSSDQKSDQDQEDDSNISLADRTKKELADLDDLDI